MSDGDRWCSSLASLAAQIYWIAVSAWIVIRERRALPTLSYGRTDQPIAPPRSHCLSLISVEAEPSMPCYFYNDSLPYIEQTYPDVRHAVECDVGHDAICILQSSSAHSSPDLTGFVLNLTLAYLIACMYTWEPTVGYVRTDNFSSASGGCRQVLSLADLVVDMAEARVSYLGTTWILVILEKLICKTWWTLASL